MAPNGSQRGRGRPSGPPRGRGRPRTVSEPRAPAPPPAPRGRGRGRGRVAVGAARGGRGGAAATTSFERGTVDVLPPLNEEQRALDKERPKALRRYDDKKVKLHELKGGCTVPCPKCGALHWIAERAEGKTWGGEKSTKDKPLFADCCCNGVVRLPVLDDPPVEIREFLTDSTPVGLERRKAIRQYNSALAFTSTGVQRSDRSNGVDRSVDGPLGVNTYRISGRCYHLLGSLLPVEGEEPKFAQIYVAGGTEEDQAVRRSEFHTSTDVVVLDRLAQAIRRENQYVAAFVSFVDRMRDGDDDAAELRLTVMDPHNKDPRRYNRPTAPDEIAAVYVGDEEAASAGRDIVVHLQGGGLKRFSELHAAFQTLHFVLLFPHGEQGWRPGIPLADFDLPNAPANGDDGDGGDGGDAGGGDSDEEDDGAPAKRKGRGGSTSVTLAQHATFYTFDRQHHFNAITRSGQLFQEWLVDEWVRTETNRLRWVELNQSTLRAESYKGLTDAISDGNAADQVGKRVILPSSFAGGGRQMHALYQDAMAIVRWDGKPDAFVTMTCNPAWQEITSELRDGETAQDRPDLVSRVFDLKLRQLQKELFDNAKGVLGRCVARIWVIEYQKRGLPHAHILLSFHKDDKPQSPEEIDRMTCAELPDPVTEPELFRIVTTCMLHTCSSRCKSKTPPTDGQTEKCTKGFPRDFCDETRIGTDSYPQYRRRDNGRSFTKTVKVDNRSEKRTFTNADVVPYNKYLSKRFDCHINVEICTSIRAVKYLFKYVYKGHDRANVVVAPAGQNRDEVENYLDSRWVTANEAHRRLLGKPMHGHSPSVERLALHLEDDETVAFDEDATPEEINALLTERKDSTLTAFFKACTQNPQLFANVLYPDAPQKFVYDKKHRSWRPRKRGFKIGRVHFAGPSSGERYYLRMLLYHKHCPKSFEDLRTVGGTTHGTFQAACLALGLLEGDEHIDGFLREIGASAGGKQLRRVFATILIEVKPADPRTLWDTHKEQITDDCKYLLRIRNLCAEPTEEDAFAVGLQLLDQVLQQRGRKLTDFDMPAPSKLFDLDAGSRVIREETSYDKDELDKVAAETLERANEEQRVVIQKVTDAVRAGSGGIFFLDGPGGTGKTFVENGVAAILRAEGRIVLMVGSSGICALLLKGGRTAHSRFSIPIELYHNTVLAVPKQSELADLFRRTQLIIWDEAPMQHCHCAEAVDRMLRDIRDCRDKQFGGVAVLFAGDWRQCLPVVPKGSQAQIKTACLISSYLWRETSVLRLTVNMRLRSRPMNEAEAADASAFATWLMQIGDGLHDGVEMDAVKVPERHVVASEDELIQHVYDRLAQPFATEQEAMSYFQSRAILAPTNDEVDALNNRLQSCLPAGSEGRTYLSADSVLEQDEQPDPNQQLWPSDYLNSIVFGGFPLHQLTLRVGMVVLLLRNLDTGAGLCNGTRLLVTKLGEHSITARILGGEFAGNEAYLMRVKLDSNKASGLPFVLRRCQFPVRLGLALTINKSQGQSLAHVGLYLSRPVFTHGQFYVGVSRAQFPSGLKMLLSADEEGGRLQTKNVVYADVLELARS